MPVELPEGFDEGYLSDIEDQEEPQVAAPAAVRPPYQWHDEYAGPGAPRLESPETPQEFQTILKGPQALSHAWEDVNTPFIPLSRFTPSAQTVQDAFDSLASSSPELTEEEAQRLDEARGEPGTAAKIVSGTLGGVNRFTESLTSPLSIATLGVGALPKVVGRLASGAFALQMANQVGPASARLADAIESGDPEAISGAATDLAALGTGAGGAAFHGVAPGRVMLPESMRALGETAPDLPQREGANAIQERQTTPVLRNVPEQPGESAGGVPAQEGGERVPPSGIPSGDAGGAPPAETPGAGEIPLAQEAFSRAEGAEPPKPVKVSEVESVKPTENGGRIAIILPNGTAVVGGRIHADTWNRAISQGVATDADLANGKSGFVKPDGTAWGVNGQPLPKVETVHIVGREEPKAPALPRQRPAEPAKPEVARLSKSDSKNAFGDPMGSSYHATPADWEAWKKVQQDFKEAAKSGDTEQISRVWGENERIKNKYGGMPPAEPKPEVAAAEAGGERALTETSPLDPKEFTATDAEGNVVADIPKLQKALEEGKIKGGEAANQLLSHLLKGDEAHPLSGIQIKDLAPEELKALTGGQTAYRGRFSLPRGERAGRVEVLTRNDAGQPITHAEFVKTLNHELTHNAVTSKYDSAPEEVKGDLQKLFDHAKAQAAGTEFEGHNAMRDVHEFLSEAASSPKIQTWLTKMAYEGAGKAKNAWGKFVELVHKILRAPANLPLTALDEAMRISGELEGVRREAKVSEETKFSPAEEERSKWTRATSGESGFISLAPVQSMVNKAAPAVRAAWDAIKGLGAEAKETGKEAIGGARMSDYKRSVLNWSSKLQRSFGEAAAAQKEIQQKVPDPIRREGITNWIQAGGDQTVLRQRAAATSDPKLRKGYEAALSLNPDEIAVAQKVKQVFDDLGQRGQAKNVLNNFKENYVTQIWKLGPGLKGWLGGSSRTLKEKFKYAKASTFPTFFDGEQAGYTPKTKDISKLLPVYMHEMNSVIAARELVEQMSKGVASDGRPLVAARGVGVPVAGDEKSATLVMPKAVKGDTTDYRAFDNQPAFQGWRWATKDTAGNPVFLKSDLAVHPEAYGRLKAVLGRSAIREWYSTPTTRLAAIPKLAVRGLDAANAGTKRTMLGLLAPFHQVQEGTHAVGHRVNPFGNIPKIDLANNLGQQDAARHGLMLLPDKASENQFMEGFRPSGLVSRIPGVGKIADAYSNYLFHQYIPGLKFKTYEAILNRNAKVYARDLAAGKIKLEDVKLLSATQANAAYGHLNYTELSRNPTIQHIAQLGLLAPDFLEARGRFAAQAAKGLTGAKAGREQLLALATLAIGQATAAFVTAKLTGGEWDKKHPFEFHIGSRTYTMRSVPEDISHLLTNTRAFIYSRLSPLIGKGAVQYLSGVDFAGRKVSAGETTRELATQPIPLTLRSLPGVRDLSGKTRPGSLKAWEELAGAAGVRISRFNRRGELADIHQAWLKNNPDPRVKADFETKQSATFPVSKYKALDAALQDRDEGAIAKAITELRPLVKKDSDILKRMRPYIGEGLETSRKPIFHESAALERKFVKSLKPEEKALYDRALKERQEEWLLFLKVWRQRGARATSPTSATP